MPDTETLVFQKERAQFNRDGYCVLKHALDASTIEAMRQQTCSNLHLMGQTRASSASYHMAGFHRFAPFAHMTRDMGSNPAINAFLAAHFMNKDWAEIGLTDITVNRSQHWHTDLLRGKFAHHLADLDVWAAPRAQCIKALAYLQDGRSLWIVPGSHRTPTPLDDRALEDIARDKTRVQLEVEAGDVVMMDIRALHRGATDREMDNPALVSDPKILVSMVFGQESSTFATAMETGNRQRMAAWDRTHLPEQAELTPLT